MEDKVFFVLPSLINDKLVTDDSDSYFLSILPRSVANDTCAVIMNDFSKRFDDLKFEAKNVITNVSEVVGCCLSFDIPKCELMSTGLRIYKRWLMNLGMFKNAKERNKYIQRIIKHISQPFDFNRFTVSVTASFYEDILQRILDMFTTTLLEVSYVFDKETWSLLFKVIIKITDSIFYWYNTYTDDPKEWRLGLLQKSISTIFKISLESGIKDQQIWSVYIKHCKKWSSNHYFVGEWIKDIKELSLLVFHEIMGEDCTSNSDLCKDAGRYDRNFLTLIFRNVLSCVDFVATNKSQSGLLQVQTTVSALLNDMIFLFQGNGILRNRFTGDVFFKLFGNALTTVSPHVSKSYNDGLSILISNLFLAVGKLEFINDELPAKLATIAFQISELGRSDLDASLIYYGKELFLQQRSFIPSASHRFLSIIKSFQYDTAFKTKYANFFASATSLTVSASHVVSRGSSSYSALIRSAFENLYNLGNELSYVEKFSLLSCLCFHGIDILLPIQKFVKGYKKSDINFFISLIYLLAAYIRKDPSITDEIASRDIYQILVEFTINCETDDPKKILVALSCLSSSILEWKSEFFYVKEHAFHLLSFINHLIQMSKVKKLKIKQALYLIISKMFVKAPFMEYFNKKIGCNNINEKTVEEKLNMRGSRKWYVTIGSSTLICFFQKEERMVILSRGPSGKTVWEVSDESKSQASMLRQCRLTIDDELPPPPDPELIRESVLGIGMSTSSLQSQRINMTEMDFVTPKEIFLEEINNTKNSYIKEFQTLMNWDRCSIKSNISGSFEQMRPRFVDFLLTMGLVDEANRLSVRLQPENDVLYECIDNYDRLETCPIHPAYIAHILPGDKTINISDYHYTRMTNVFKHFLSSVGQHIDVSNTDLPETKSPIPCIPFSCGFVALVAPALCNEKVKTDDNSFLYIIFNESTHEISSDLEIEVNAKHIIVIRPIYKDLYIVNELASRKHFISPFINEKILDIESLSFLISLLADLNASQLVKNCTGNSREDAFKPLVSESANSDLISQILSI